VQGSVLQTEVYEYTGALAFANTGAGNDLAALRLEEFEAQAKSFQGSGNHRALLRRIAKKFKKLRLNLRVFK
jgi:type VI secretion system secreted protein VgrG